LDGHIVLSRALASRNHYPAIDVLASISRVAGAVTDPQVQAIAAECRRLVAGLREAEELVSIGAYVVGASPALVRALQCKGPVLEFLRQGLQERSSFDETVKRMATLVGIKR